MFKGCWWKGIKVPCSKIFNTHPTDQGMCCTFNIDSAEEMFKESKYREMVDFMQKRDQNMSYERDKSLGPKWEDGTEPYSEPGRKKGLTVILDAHSNMVTGGSVPEDFDGYYAVIDSTDTYPMTTRKSVLLRPGHNNIVSMGATKVTADENIRDIKPLDRNCLFKDEMNMNVHNSYTQANCMLECQIAYAESKVSIQYLISTTRRSLQCHQLLE